MASTHDEPDPFGIDEGREILDAQIGRVHARFEALDRSFRRLLYAFVLLALALFSFLFYPYVSVQGERARRVAERDAVVRETARLEEAIAQRQEALALLQTQREHAFVNSQRTVAFEFHDTLWASARQHEEELFELKDRFLDLRLPGAGSWTIGEGPGPDLLSSLGTRREFAGLANAASRNRCQWQIGEPWVRCEIERELRAAHDGVLAALRRSPAAESLGLTSDLDDLHDSLWRPDGSGDRADRISAGRLDVSVYWRDYLATLAGAIEVQQNRLHEAEADRTGRTALLERLDEEVSAADAQLAELRQFNDLETPIGRLPVGLDRIILLFPLLLGAGAYLLAGLFCETLRTRELLRGLYARKTGDVTARQAALIAPLWLDPADPVQGRTGRYLLLAVAPALIVGAVAALLANGFLGEDFLQRSWGARMSYLVLYACGLAISMAGVLQIGRAVRSVRDPARNVGPAGTREGDAVARLDR